MVMKISNSNAFNYKGQATVSAILAYMVKAVLFSSRNQQILSLIFTMTTEETSTVNLLYKPGNYKCF